MTKHRAINAKQLREDIRGLAESNPELLADTTFRIAKRERNQAIALADAEESTRELFAFLGTLLVMPLMGVWAGRLDAEREEMIAQWEAEGAGIAGTTLIDHPEPWDHQLGSSDPLKWWIFPKLAVVPIGFALLASITNMVRRPDQPASGFERFATLSAMTSTTYLLARWVADWSRKRTEKKIADRTLLVSAVRPTAA